MIDSRAAFDRIFIEGMTFMTLIGVLEHEKVQPQPVTVDVILSVMPVQATRTDRLEQTISYAVAYERISQIIQTEHFGLVERLAGSIAEKLLLDHESLMAVTVTIHKPEAPLPGPFTSTGITITRVRGDFGLLTQADLSLGTNLGDRLETLRQAVLHLAGHPQIELVATSSVYETTPVGLLDQPDFLNLVARIRTTLDPFSLLFYCQSLETRFGRERLVRWGPRTLDIDLLTYGHLMTQTAILTLPHPRMQEREFVQVPLRELDSGLAKPTPAVRFTCKLP
ncbi:MAG: 2-amino-4-hydroxy-6-hydroxymethyldihydropteridine diphosphokinase [Clostridia bacterium]|nr:2-amino-4-hydroxy-6-hydroxymethyldihydropteridine diphosphokinase [Clostridia bacterium]NCC75094.1 2-amino-4-hydroxy-6-hydroxymethyldihydropteridine diphosphokinase [Clostridia bacterium]